jgi:shikimate dehydrogenase
MTVVSTLPGTAGAGIDVRGPLLDVVYDPWPTALARSAQANGQPVVGGLEVLIGQAVRQVELMTGSAAPAAAMRQAGELELARRHG